jgi:hypothetical protein
MVICVERSDDAKLTSYYGMSATYVSQASCPPGCALLGAGCYGEHGRVQFHTNRLNASAAAAAATPQQLAELEAAAIDRLSGWFKLRTHVVGDCSTVEAAGLVGAAMVRHEARRGRHAWTYTHAWPDVPAAAWRGARVLASCDTGAQLAAARRRGYVGLALIIPPTRSPKAQRRGRLTVIPCPAQFRRPDGTRHSTCDRCQLCADLAAGRHPRTVVGFQPDAQTAAHLPPGIGAARP